MGGCFSNAGRAQSAAAGPSAAWQPAHSDSLCTLGVGQYGLYSADASGNLARWSLRASPGRLGSIAAHERGVTELAIAQDLLASASRDKVVRLWRSDELSPALPQAELPPMDLAVTGCDFVDDDARLVVAGSRGGFVAVYDTQTAAVVRQEKISRNVVTSIRRLPRSTGQFLQTSEDKQLRVWDAASCSVVAEFSKQANILYCCTSSSDGMYYATGSAGTDGSGCLLSIWDARQRKLLHSAVGHKQTVTGVCTWHHDGQEGWATSGRDGQVLLWSLDGQSSRGSYSASQPLEAITSHENTLYIGAKEGNLGSLSVTHLREAAE